jgi:dienelactone hydrolase
MKKPFLALNALIVLNLAGVTPVLAEHGGNSAEMRDLDSYFPMTVPPDRETWETRAAQLRRQVAVSQGLFPMPPKTPLKAQIFSDKTVDDYRVAKVVFEAMPGFFVTGSLFRPASVKGKIPGVLCPHGHWPNGRHMEQNDATVAKEIRSGGESLICAAKNPLQARCVHLARMGMVVFHYDMIGYADSQQLAHCEPHKFAKQAPERSGLLFSPQAEGHLQSVMGLQTWSSIRALDFLCELPEIDPTKLGVTGASGGATQTFLLSALDDRIAANFPAVMVSTAMQGGCTCENATYLRIGSGNIELAALFAPKPMGLTCADDWTKEMPTKGFPQLQQVYALYGKPENVHLTDTRKYEHNYNSHSRRAMYQWLAKHLLGKSDAPPEREYPFLTAKDLTVWDGGPSKPNGGIAEEKSILAHWQSSTAIALKANPKSATEALETVVGRDLQSAGEIMWEVTEKTEDGATQSLRIQGSLRNQTHRETLRALWYYPKNWNGEIALYLDPTKGAKACSKGMKSLAQGIAVGGIDWRLTPPKVANPRESAAYTFGYNYPLILQQVHDLLTLFKHLKTDAHGVKKISIYAENGAKRVLDLAKLLAPDVQMEVHSTEPKFDYHSVESIYDPNFLPGALRYGW